MGNAKELPGPTGWCLLGTFAGFLRGDLLKPFVGLFEKFGPLFRIPLPFGQDLVMLAHPDAVEQVLRSRQQNYRKGSVYDGARLLLGNGLVTLYLAGHETTASLLTWALYWLAKRPDIAERVTAEIDRHIVNDNPCSDDLKADLRTSISRSICKR